MLRRRTVVDLQSISLLPQPRNGQGGARNRKGIERSDDDMGWAVMTPSQARVHFEAAALLGSGFPDDFHMLAALTTPSLAAGTAGHHRPKRDGSAGPGCDGETSLAGRVAFDFFYRLSSVRIGAPECHCARHLVDTTHKGVGKVGWGKPQSSIRRGRAAP